MSKPAVTYLLLTVALLLLLAFSRAPHSHPARLPTRRLAPIHHQPFDPLLSQLEQEAEEQGLLDRQAIQERLDSALAEGDHRDENLGKIGFLEEFFSEQGRLNVTERLTYLFPLLDRYPKDDVVSFRELEIWNQRQAMDRLVYITDRRMKVHDKDGDEEITLREFLSGIPQKNLDITNMERKTVNWWKEQFVNADGDGNGSLNKTEFNHFLHPEDSREPKIERWMLKEKMREMDRDKDGKISLEEFRDRSNGININYPSFDKEPSDHNLSIAEKQFAELDVNQDGYLSAEELKPISIHLWPGELWHATLFTKYLMHAADDDKDGKLTLEEMLNHHHAFYTTVMEESYSDDDEYEDYHPHDELR
ncbi:hypothetical protein J5N97_028946 [Dioscorea zingiberensis]|uniref:EF-hand domain-containing protein n=1 Tax=Dioscorea zingiberensis TaxID=325984 RepID=A0A9D5C064_9LILI|nr:hypothetical protein J5N97_028946 [Dioscorea zingiberensis]